MSATRVCVCVCVCVAAVPGDGNSGDNGGGGTPSTGDSDDDVGVGELDEEYDCIQHIKSETACNGAKNKDGRAGVYLCSVSRP